MIILLLISLVKQIYSFQKCYHMTHNFSCLPCVKWYSVGDISWQQPIWHQIVTNWYDSHVMSFVFPHQDSVKSDIRSSIAKFITFNAGHQQSQYWATPSYTSRHFQLFNSLRLRQNGRHFANDIFTAYSWMEMYEFRLEFHWNLFLRVQLTIFHHWFR